MFTARAAGDSSRRSVRSAVSSAHLRPGLQAIVAGSRDRTLADAPDIYIYYRIAAEILFLIDTLEKPR